MQRLSRYVMDGVAYLTDAEPAEAPHRPRYEIGVRAIQMAMDFVQAFPELHTHLRSFLANNESSRHIATSAAVSAPTAAAAHAVVTASHPQKYATMRSEKRREGNECVRTVRSRRWTSHSKKMSKYMKKKR